MGSPTRSRRSKGPSPGTAEAEAWPEHAQVLSLMGCGFSYSEALRMSPVDTRRYIHINQSWAIPPEDRLQGSVLGTADDLRAAFGG